MDDEITAAALRRAFADGDLGPLVLPDGEVVGSVEADVEPLRDTLMNADWVRAIESGAGDVGETLSVWPSTGVQVNFFFGWGAPIEFDIDLRQINGEDAVNSLIRLLRLVSSAAGKDVVVRPEGQLNACPVFRVDAATGEATLNPRS